MTSSQPVLGGVVHELPADLRKALVANTTALAAWKDITPYTDRLKESANPRERTT